MSSFLITGGAGFLGINLVRHLLADEIANVILARVGLGSFSCDSAGIPD